MDYKAIGQRIRKYRKLKKLSQEQLAEMAEISTTHMSHIETGSTKLSLAVLADLAKKLEVSADTLIFGERTDCKSEDIERIVADCTQKEIDFITAIAAATKEALARQYRSK